MGLFNKGGEKLLFVISAPSGTGKTTIVEELVRRHPDDLARAITCTTRKPRQKERDGVDYRFFSKEEFDRRKGRGEFLESATIYGNEYGTLKETIEGHHGEGKHVFLVIDVKGSLELIQKGVSAIFLFILPPSDRELEERIRGRKTETEEMIHKRLERARFEMEKKSFYDYILVNDDFDQACDVVQGIVIAEDHKNRGNHGQKSEKKTVNQ